MGARQDGREQSDAGGAAVVAAETITRLVAEAKAGSRESAEELLRHVYNQLKRVAQRQLGRERPGHTLQATSLVHEAYLRLMAPGGVPSAGAAVEWPARAHFFHAAAEAMRRILIEHARARGRAKRGGGRRRVPLNVLDLAEEPEAGDVLAMDEAVAALGREDARAAEIVRLRFYAGLSVEETAQALGTSERTVKREWQFARAWLFRQLGGGDAGGGTGPPGSKG